ncbi:YsnF/AvaK domain-containing protein [Ectobacillus ponti]|uniref:YsnF/AvaK domain-containing protein n=1 Tax=Ectobacillus ponti TaxID=2961894 RepID=A0AA41X848_9BACI|nr:YsnF/AvaK domain-containing protein [Ectobacillus ponti]MCP8968100.1 YsnF/AvaK domain-containing protein [Ectobacillus ponti]
MSDLFERDGEREDIHVADDGKLQLRQEELDVSKTRVRTGEVILSKEIVEEPKVMDVPVMHEEVVIERRTMHEPSDEPISEDDTIHIPVSQETVSVGKHTVVTEEVAAYKREIAETQRIEETVKREEAYIETEGDPHIVRNSAHIDGDESIR